MSAASAGSRASVSRIPSEKRSTGSSLVQRKCACGSGTTPLTDTCDECQAEALQLRPKLAVGPADDPLEREADEIADRAIRIPDLKPRGQAVEERQEEGRVRAEVPVCPDASVVGSEAPPIVRDLLRSPGRPLDSATRAFMEQRLGHDFARVRVHSSPAAEVSAQSFGALAYTVRSDVVFGAGRYAPTSTEGRRLLAHELAHVVQQGGAAMSRRGAGPPAKPGTHSNHRPLSCVAAPMRRAGSHAICLQRQAESSSPSAEAADDRSRVLAAAKRARSASSATAMMIDGSSIVYGIIKLFLPDYSDRISGVSYDPVISGVQIDTKGGSISIAVGKEFILGVSEKTLNERALELGSALLQAAPRKRKKRGLLELIALEQRKDSGSATDKAKDKERDKKKEKEGKANDKATEACPCERLKSFPCLQVGMINSAFNDAKKWLPIAQTKLASFQSKPESKAVGKVRVALKRHFGQQSAEAARSVISFIKTLRKKINLPRCRDDCVPNDHCEGGDLMHSSFLETACYEFCERFFNVGWIPRATAVLHEMVHKWLGGMGHGEVYEWKDNYPPPIEAQAAGPNPDSVACLIRDLGK